MSRDIVLKTQVYPYPLPDRIGDLFLKGEIYSQGNDFTNENSKTPDYCGVSTMKRIWNRESIEYLADTKEVLITSIWHDGYLQGAFIWLKPFEDNDVNIVELDEVPKQSNYKPKFKLPVAPLGSLMTFLKKEYRGNGIMKEALETEIMPSLLLALNKAKEINAFPIIKASDACLEMVKKLEVIPTSSTFNARSLKFKSDVWSFWKQRDFYQFENAAWQQYLVEPIALGSIKKKRANTNSVLAHKI